MSATGHTRVPWPGHNRPASPTFVRVAGALPAAGAALLSIAAAGCAPVTTGPSASVCAVVLGIAQDGGHPHLGCQQGCCLPARRNPKLAHRVACLGLVDRQAGRWFLIDATPDIVRQVGLLEEVLGEKRGRQQNPVEGILLTHAHIGHYTGLMYLGRESMAARGVAVYATDRMVEFLTNNGPWSLLVSERHIEPMVMSPNNEIALTSNLHVTALPVPHRDEFTDTVAYLVRGPARTLLWLPDIDRWEDWDRRIEQVVASVDLAFLDGTFYDADELPGRDLSDVPHPLVVDTMRRFRGAGFRGNRVFFIHVNHTNPLLRQGSRPLGDLRRRGFDVPTEGSCWDL